MHLRKHALPKMVAHGGSTSCIEFYNQKIYNHCSFLSAGPIPLDLSIPKMDDIERQISRDFDGWVSNGGIWRPAECEAKVKVSHNISPRSGLCEGLLALVRDDDVLMIINELIIIIVIIIIIIMRIIMVYLTDPPSFLLNYI